MLWCMLHVCVGAQAQSLPYTMKIGAEAIIYTGPGVDYEYAGCVGEDGVYTIVEESLDEYDAWWGRLKSGAGWVNLSRIRADENAPVTACFAQQLELEEWDYQSYIADDSEYAVRIAFRAKEQLKGVQFGLAAYTDDGGRTYEPFYWISEMEKGEYLVTQVVFYGDMTTYMLAFADSCGEPRYFEVSLSGMDGSVVMSECEL